MVKTLKELAQDALDVQDACNLSGVAHGFSRAMSDLFDHCKSTDRLNHHSIARLWIDKLTSLSGIQSLDTDLSKDYDVVYDLAKGESI